MQKIIFTLVMTIGFLCFSCTEETLPSPNSSDKGVKLHFALQERKEVNTRSTTPLESVIDHNSVYVLVSSHNSESPLLLDYAIAVEMNDGIYRVELEEQTSQVSVDIIVNAKTILDAKSVDWQKGVTPMSEIRAALLTDQLPVINDIVSANPSTHPMCGNYIASKIGASTSIGTPQSPVPLIPATIKITVENRVAAGVSYTFDIIGANMGAAPEKGFVMPREDCSTIVTRNYGAEGDVSSMLCSVENIDNVQTTLPLFCYESVAENDTYILLKAKYNNQEGYYKLGFFTDTDKLNSRPLLRGLHYKMTVRAVLTAGYRTAEEAIAAPASNGIIYDVDVNDGDSHDIITNGVQYLGVSNSEYIGYHSNYVNEFEIYYTDGINNAADNKLPLTPFTAAILTYTTDPLWNEGVVTATAGITLVDEVLNKVASIPLPLAPTTTQTMRKELRIFMDNEFKEGELNIRIGNLQKIIKIKRENSFTILGGSVSLGSDIVFAQAKTLANPIYPSMTCDSKAYCLSYNSAGTPIQTGDGRQEIDPSKELFLQISNRFEWAMTDYCYGELYLHHNTSAGRTKVSFSVEMFGSEPFADSSFSIPFIISQAFWKNSEKGERLIQLVQHQLVQYSNLNAFPHVGRWQARVIAGADFIRLSDWDSTMTVTNNRFDGDPEDRPVLGDKTVLYGKDPYIRFRIGLTTTNAGNNNRYGLVQLIYLDHRVSANVTDPLKSSCLIFVRQGETPDNILTPGKEYQAYTHKGSSLQTFTAPDVKFSPYGLVDPLYGVGGNDYTDHTAITPDTKAILAPYPSYAPYLFQWSGDRLYHYSNPQSSISGWKTWNDIDPYNPTTFIEHCPEGYITPPAMVDNTEVNKGLRYYFPKQGSNAVTGICVDGYIDRYIQNNNVAGNEPFKNHAPNTHCTLNQVDGMTIFNPQTMASIYFQNHYLMRNPFTEFPGEIWADRALGWDYMWTSTPGEDTTKGDAIITTFNWPQSSSSSTQISIKKATGLPIRCIKDPLKP